MNGKKTHLACIVSEEHASFVSENEVLRIILGAVALLRSTSLGEYSAVNLTFRGLCIVIYSYNKTN